MKNINDVLKQKEAQVQQIQKEIEALKIAARLLADDTEAEVVPKPIAVGMAGTPLATMSRPNGGKETGHGGPTWDAINKQFP